MFIKLFYKIHNIFEPKKQIQFKGKIYEEVKLLGEGGFGFVYLVKDPLENLFAMKHLNFSDLDTKKFIEKEIEIWSKVKEVNNIVSLIDYEIYNDHVKCLMEYTKEGTLLDFLNTRKSPLLEKEIIFVLKQIAEAISALHTLDQPVSHRDIKIENILKFGKTFKLCDFGSCTWERLNPKTASKKDIARYFNLLDKHSTFIYRPPETVDRLGDNEINEKVDIWMLGCVAYILAFKKHPFQDAQKLTIINCAYSFPSTQNYSNLNSYSEKFCDLVRLMLNPNPNRRPSIYDIKDLLKKWDTLKEIDLPEECLEIKTKQTGITYTKFKSKISNDSPDRESRSLEDNEEDLEEGDQNEEITNNELIDIRRELDLDTN